MSIDVHDPAVATRKAARRARRRAIETVETARAVDLQGTADTAKRTAKKIARRTAKRAAKEARVAAERATRRQTKRAGRRVRRVALGALLVGALIAAAVVLVQRSRGAASAPPVTPEVDRPATPVHTAGTMPPDEDGRGRTAEMTS